MRKMIFKYILSAVILLIFSTHVSAEGRSIDRILVVVNDGIITEQQVLNEEKKLRLELRQGHVATPSEQTLRNQAIEHLIDKELQLQLAKNSGIEVTDTALDQTINDIAKRNRITVAVLKQKLTSEGISFPVYREDLRHQMILNQIQMRQLAPTLTVSDDEIKQMQNKLKSTPQGPMRYHVIDILVPTPEGASPIDVTNAQTKAKNLMTRIQKGEDFSHLAQLEAEQSHLPNGGDFGWQGLHQLPDLFSQKVQRMTKGQVLGPIQAGNGLHIIKLVDVEGPGAGLSGQHYTKQTHVRHILIKTDKTTNDEIAKVRLLRLKEKLEVSNGIDFTEIAKSNSQDTQSSKVGGDLGWVPEGILDPNFEQAMNHLAINQIGGPVKTQFGWHLMQVLGRRETEDSKEIISNQARNLAYQQKMQQALPNWLQQLRNGAYIKRY